MKYEITRNGSSTQATFENGMVAYYWEDQGEWALKIENDPSGVNLIRAESYGGLVSLAGFAANWDDNVAAACKKAGMSAQQWFDNMEVAA